VKILFFADGRSPIALNWISFFVQDGHEVHLASSFPCQPDLPLASVEFIPTAFSQLKKNSAPGAGRGKRSPAVGLRTLARQWLGVLTLPGAARQLAQAADRIQPDLMHAMRIPYEGMTSALALSRLKSIPGSHIPPLLISIWGNDFTLHAHANPWMAYLTRQALHKADALHADCQRDIHLAHEWGFSSEKPVTVLPGAGGIQLETFYPPALDKMPGPVVIQPRGVRAYVRNDTFFHAIPLILARQPGVHFICPAMSGEAQIEHWVDELNIRQAVELLPAQGRVQMAALYRSAQVLVSPTTHDGTPNTLLEALACGCFPVAGDISSLREWITPGVNGLLFDPADPHALAQAVLSGLEQEDMRSRARDYNLRLVRERADYSTVMSKAQAFYLSLLRG
jgi:glycosyltransferase involved in cell wall biosynthesis